VIDKDSQTVRLMPPTGLLGAFLGPGGRSIKFQDLKNVELRHAVLHESSTKRGDDGMDIDVTQKRDLFGIYLTLKDETLLLIQLQHVSSTELAGHKVKTRTLMDTDYDAEKEMAYLRQHQRDQSHHDDIAEFIEDAAYVVAAATGRSLVRTEVGEERV
jgi:hypothetical protein